MTKHLAKAALLLSLISSSAHAQLSWPAADNQSKPWTRWWWQGSAVDRQNIDLLLNEYNKAGLGGVEITPIYGVKGEEKRFIPFLTPQWTDMLLHTLTRARQLNMGVDMATGTGWPFGGPWVKNEDASKFVTSRVFTLNAGEYLKDTVNFHQQRFTRSANPTPTDYSRVTEPVSGNKDLQSLALDQIQFERTLKPFAVIAYTDKGTVDILKNVDANGILKWTPTQGTANVYALFQGLHGKMVERAAPGGEGLAIDHFSRPAIDHYLARFNKSFKGKDISSLRAFFNDSYEVDDARGQANWSPLLLEEFKKRRGYDLLQHLPALFNRQEKENRVLFDYRQTVAELILENFTEPWAGWAKSHKALVRNQSHGSPGNTMDLYAAVDIPETEGTELLRMKFATSAAHVTGKPLAAAESATWLNEHFVSTLADVKLAIDRYFIGGVNHIVYHGTNYSPKDASWPGWLFYAAVHFHPNNPFWKDFSTLNQYVTRAQSFLQKGKPANDVLVFYPFDDSQMERGRDLLKHYDAMRPEFNGTLFNEVSEKMLETGYSFDFISEKQLLRVGMTGSELQSGGNTYKVVMLPGNKYMNPATFRHLLDLVAKGAKLVVYKKLPDDVPGLAALEQRQQQLNQLLKSLNWTSNDNGVAQAKIGNGFVYMSDHAPAALSAAGVSAETMAASGLQFIKRHYAGGFVYFITNSSPNHFNGYVEINEKAASVGLFDPMTGASGLAILRTEGTPAFKLHLQPGQSIITQLYPAKQTGAEFKYYERAGDVVVIPGNWKVSFLNGGPTLPVGITQQAIAPWTAETNKEYQRFSGTASYSTSFKKPQGNAVAWQLDLGKTHESAEVWLNGKKLTTLIGPVFNTVIPAASLLAENKLEIRVSNSMANRIIGLEKDGVNWKRFYNTNFPARLAENRGKDNLFTAINWAPRTSGLEGPVTLTPLNFSR